VEWNVAFYADMVILWVSLVAFRADHSDYNLSHLPLPFHTYTERIVPVISIKIVYHFYGVLCPEHQVVECVVVHVNHCDIVGIVLEVFVSGFGVNMMPIFPLQFVLLSKNYLLYPL
jgi:hypothetical protein